MSANDAIQSTDDTRASVSVGISSCSAVDQ